MPDKDFVFDGTERHFIVANTSKCTSARRILDVQRTEEKSYMYNTNTYRLKYTRTYSHTIKDEDVTHCVCAKPNELLLIE